jgi:hypothetical protein
MRLLVVIALVAAALSSVACKRPCVSAAQCKRTCECTNEDTDDTEKCTVGFLCEVPEGSAEGTCEDEYESLQCPEFCAKFAANGVCGTNRCTANSDCERTMSCDCLDAQGNVAGTKFDCTVAFECDGGDRVCSAGFTNTDQQLCATNCRAGVQLPPGCF